MMKRTIVAGAVAALLVITGCSDPGGTTGDAGEEATTQVTPTQTPADGDAPTGAGPQAGAGAQPGVSGLIAAITDDTLQVQDDSSQTAVRFDADTTITRQADLSTSEIQVGDCVIVMSEDSEVQSVTVSQPVDGECRLGGFQPGGQEPGGTADEDPPSPPDGAPSGDVSAPPADREAPSGDGFPDSGEMISGEVVAVSEDSLSIAQDDTTQELVFGEDVAVTGQVEATAEDLATGLCVSAQGEADDSGGMDAESLRLSDPDESGSCITGMGPRRDG